MSRLKRLIVEIHRRSLWQVLLVYCGGALVAYQAVQALTEGLGLPQWFPAFALVLFIVGLPIVVATALVREEVPRRRAGAARISAGEDVEGGPVPAGREAGRRRRFLTWRYAVGTFVIALAAWGVVAFGWLLVGRGEQRADVVAGARPSIAALPFVNRSGLQEDEYFTDGIHDEILSRLAKLSGLSVRGRTSVMQYRDSPKNLRQIGEELDARYLLEGGVQRAGETVRINLQLVDAENDEHLWAEVYDRQLSVENLLAVQSEVALRVAEALDATLTADEATGLGARPTDNLEAYDYYLRGNDYLNRGALGFLERAPLTAAEMYERAVELDPDFALGWAALAEAHVVVWEQGYDPNAGRLERARPAAERALALEPDLAEAHRALGRYFENQFDYGRAGEEYERARRTKPNDAELLVRIAGLLERQGEGGEALPLLDRAAELDPRSVEAATDYGHALARAGRYPEAERQFDRAIALAPDQIAPYAEKLDYYLYVLGDREGARRVLRDGSARIGRMAFATNLMSWEYYYFRVFADELAESLDRLSIESFGHDSVSRYQYHLARGWSHAVGGRPERSRASYDSARVILEDWLGRAGGEVYWLRDLSWAYAGLGRSAEAIATARRLLEEVPPSQDALWGNANAYALAEVHVMLGQTDEALELLTSWVERAPYYAGGLRVDPLWDPLRDDPRFQALLERRR
ncbi:MAG: tetratricopeptide repeat protein [Gemmatimonadales bacterium]|jgi:serine/threonine-protein kinase